jgi:hypothetical protein
MRRRNIGNECVEYLERKISEGSAMAEEKNIFLLNLHLLWMSEW